MRIQDIIMSERWWREKRRPQSGPSSMNAQEIHAKLKASSATPWRAD